MSKPEAVGKIILVGNPGVGKTSILSKLINNDFKYHTNVTEKPENYMYTTQTEEKTIKLVLWDTAGQEKYRAINRTYYRNAIGAFIIVSVEDPDVEKSISDWSREINNNLKSEEVEKIILFNKCDLVKERNVSDEQISQIQEDEEIQCFGVSALNGQNIQQAIDSMVEKVKDRLSIPKMQDTEILQKNKSKKKKDDGCC